LGRTARGGGVDGPVVPCAAAGALMFTPDLSKAAPGAMAPSQGCV
jgi:hypothetical protein